LSCLNNALLVIGGDFNATRFISERRGNPSLRSNAIAFNSVIGDLDLMDYPIGGRCFTWSNGRISPSMAKLDRFLVSSCRASNFLIL